jgi:8-oxo-dGTP pyrophosphatase MutT (NUDIX family)
MKPRFASKLREGAAAILLGQDGRLLMQLRDDVPHIRDPGMISLFGGRREADETFLDCIVREIHEEIGYYLPPARFERIGRWFGPDYAVPGGTFHGEIFLARAVPGAVAELVGIEGGVVSGVFNLESSGVEASDWRPRHDEHYHEA